MTLRLPHPIVLMLGGVAVAALLTWVLPAGEYQRREDPAAGRQVVVAGTYRRVEAAPVSAFRAVVAVPEGFVEGADVIAVILFVGGAWVVVDRLGTLAAAIGALVRRFKGRGLWIIPLVALFFGVMGALENMQEEIIPLIPVLLVLGSGMGVDALTVVGMSVGAAMVGSAFGPTNPFQAGIALRVAQLPQLSAGGLRLAMFVVGMAVWIGWTVRHARRTRAEPRVPATGDPAAGMTGRQWLILAVVLAPFAAYVAGVLAFDWGINELSAAFLIGGVGAGLIGGLRVEGTLSAYLDGMQSLLPASLIVGLARSISVVLGDGKVIDTILHGLATVLGAVPAAATAVLMVPAHALLHIPVSSVSGQAVLTMPIMAPLADLLGFSRNVAVLAYQTGAGLADMWVPTNGALLAILLAAKVPYTRWVRFAAGGILLCTLVGLAGMVMVLSGRAG